MMPPMSLTVTRWPTALIPGLRLLWSRTLFPGEVSFDSRLRLRSLVLLVVLPACLIYPCLNFRLLDPDEGRYAEIGREMLLRGDWVVPHLQGEAYLDKPPLLYWLVVLSYRLFGVHAWSARLVPALAVHGTILVTYLFGRRLLGERAAVRGALLLSLTPGVVGMGRLLVLDGLLTFWVTIGLVAGFTALQAHPQRRVGLGFLCAAATGFGVLTKGPVAIVLVVVPLVLHTWLTTGSVAVNLRAALAFAAVVAAINAPWYVAVWIARPEFGAYFFVKHNLQRFLAPFDHLEPIWYYAPVVFGGLLPASLFAWGFVKWLLAGDEGVAQVRTPALGFCLLAGGWCVSFFSLSGSKLPTYILPAFPPLALAAGYYLSTKPLSRATWVCGCWAALLLVTNAIIIPWYADLRSPMGTPGDTLRDLCSDPSMAVCCYPRSCDSAAFYLGRDDLRPTRSKFAHLLVADLLTRDRTVVLFTHNHSLAALKYNLPPDLRITREVTFHRPVPGPAWLTPLVGDTPWGLCDVAVIERTRPIGQH